MFKVICKYDFKNQEINNLIEKVKDFEYSQSEIFRSIFNNIDLHNLYNNYETINKSMTQLLSNNN